MATTATPTRWTATQPWLSTLARLVLGAVWIAAGAAKLPDLAESVRAVRAYRLLPETLVPLVGAGLPLLEVALGILLILGLGTRVGAAVSAVLMLAFVIGIASVWARGLRIDCGCFGGGGDLAAGTAPSYAPELARDLALLAVSGALARWPRSRWSLDGWLFSDSRLPDSRLSDSKEQR
jgi:uncharacterized membrane protein YphA (DoxX/SURF4 family)